MKRILRRQGRACTALVWAAVLAAALALPWARADGGAAAGAALAAVPDDAALAGKVDYLYEQALLAQQRQQWVLAQELLQHVLLLQPRHAGAALDLALLLCQHAAPGVAQQWWQQVQAALHLPPALHQALLEQLQACAPLPAGVAGGVGAGGWESGTGGAAPGAAGGALLWPGRLELELGLGHSDNANLGVSELTLELPTAHGLQRLRLLPQYGAQAAAYTTWRLGWQQALGGSGWQALLQWQGQWPQQVPQQQLQGVRLALQRPWQAQGWSGWWLGQWGWWELGGRTHQHDWSAAALLQLPPGWLPGALALQTGASVGEQALQPPLRFGIQRQQLWAELGAPWGQNGRWQVQAALQHERAQGPRPGGDAHGWHLSASAEHGLGTLAQRPLRAQAQVQWAHSRSSQAFAPGLFDRVRTQYWQMLQLGLRWQPSRQQSWTLHWQWVDNAENLPLLAYRAQALELRWQYRWQGGR